MEYLVSYGQDEEEVLVPCASTSQPPKITSGKPELTGIDRDLLRGKQHHISSVTINEKQRADQ